LPGQAGHHQRFAAPEKRGLQLVKTPWTILNSDHPHQAVRPHYQGYSATNTQLKTLFRKKGES
jgi:hypothetical protein